MIKIRIIHEQRKRHIEEIKRYGAYLLPGVYRCFCIDNNRFIWKRCENIRDYFRYAARKKNITIKMRIIAFLLGSTQRIKHSTHKSCGTSLYVSRKGNIKVFSKDMKHVSYFVKDKDLFHAAYNFNKYYANYFGKSIIESLDSSCNRINERYIYENSNWRHNENEVRNAACWLMNSTVKYLNSLKKNYKLISINELVDEIKNKINDKEIQSLLEELSEMIMSKEYIFPFVCQHNDVVLSNILKDQADFTLFDYEFYGENIFYYDSIMWIVWEAVQYSHDTYFLEFLSGKYDNYFKNIFEQVGFNYNAEERIYYVVIFIITNIRIHLITGDETNVTKYKRVINLLNKNR